MRTVKADFATHQRKDAPEAGLLPTSCCKGQLSLEALLVFAVFLAALSLSFFAIQKLGQQVLERAAYEAHRYSFISLSAAIDDSCLLGSGNVRRVKMASGGGMLQAEGKNYTFIAENFAASGQSKCPIISQGNATGELIIENRGGTIFAFPSGNP
ncbi:MAG: hypothetical protein N3G80_03890 [Candidatus Micrarchaeota archaeon]|nr:hypothetical protein [Candidatus Micrarchaeota archaeon]